MKHILEFERFIDEAYPGDRMREKHPLYPKFRPRDVRVSSVSEWLNTLTPGDMFEYYRSSETTIALFIKTDDNYVYYEIFPTVETLIKHDMYYLKSVKYPIDKIGSVGLPSKDELEDMEREYIDAVTQGALDANARYVKDWYNQLKKSMLSAARYK